MAPESKRSYKIYRAGAKIFHVCREYDEQMDESYPDFEMRLEYTNDARPFATAEQENCPTPYPALRTPPLPGNCGGCGWFHREQTPYDPIGICNAISDAARSPMKKDKT